MLLRQVQWTDKWMEGMEGAGAMKLVSTHGEGKRRLGRGNGRLIYPVYLKVQSMDLVVAFSTGELY